MKGARMNGNRFTDEEIINALKACLSGDCKICVFNGDAFCFSKLKEASLDLITKQKVEIEALKIANEKMYQVNKVQEAEIESFECSNCANYDRGICLEDINADGVCNFRKRVKR